MTAAAVARLEARMVAVDSLVCVGLDSALARIPHRFHGENHPQFAFIIDAFPVAGQDYFVVGTSDCRGRLEED